MSRANVSRLQVGTAARLELEQMLKRRVHLILNVVVDK